MNAPETQGGPSIDHLCALATVSRAGFYRFGEFREPKRAEADLRDKIQTIALKNRFYGYRRIGRELWRLHGLQINHKRLRRLMREDNLLCLRASPSSPTRRTPGTNFPSCPTSRAGSFPPASIRSGSPTSLTCVWPGNSSIWPWSSTPSRAGSIGWALADHLEASLAIEALDMALAARNPPPGLIHHSDRGVQYACAAYADRLEARGLRVSMSRAGNPYDNAKAERFMRTLKDEEVNGKTYASLARRPPTHRRLPRNRL